MTAGTPTDKIIVRWSIKTKLIVIMTILMLSLVAILTYTQISSQKTILEDELNKRIALMKENLIERGKSLIANLSQQVENDIAAFNFSGAIEVLEDRVRNNPEIKYAILMDALGMVFVNTFNPEATASELTERDTNALSQKDLAVIEYRENGKSVIEIVHPLQISTEPWGVLRLIYSLRRLDREIDISKRQIQQEIRGMIYRSVFTSLGFMVVSFIGVFLLSTTFSEPLIYLTRAARHLARGDFAVSDRLHIHSRDEVGVLAESFIEMSRDLKDSYEKLEDHSRTLEQKVEERTRELNESLIKIEQANHKIMESIQYAKRIQRSLLPNRIQVKAHLPDSFFLWLPRDVVGGDIFFTEFLKDEFIIAVLDCTGHGVPGAFMTMIASSGLTRIIREESCYNPPAILQRLNFVVKTSLQQDTEYALSDDGLDAAVCLVKPKEQSLIFSGARLPLFYTKNGDVYVVKGDRQSIGYKRSDLHFSFTKQVITIEKGMTFYMLTDGILDELGGKKRRRFGTTRFKQLVGKHSEEPFEHQKKILIQTFNAYKENYERQDDVTVVGFGFNT